MHLTRIKSLMVVSLLMALLLTGKAGADLGVGHRVGGSVSSGKTDTEVEMQAEDVTIKLTPALRTKSQDVSVPEKMNGYFLMHVIAKFTMVNTGAEKETVNTVFPMQVMGGIGRGQTVQKLKVMVDDKEATTEQIELDRQLGGFEGVKEKSKWASFDMAFEPGQTRHVTVTYEADSALVPKSFEYTDIGYVLETGADWKNNIKKGTITIEMPFEYGDQYVKLESGGPWKKDGKRLIWSFTDLEPTAEDNISVQVRADTIRAYYKKPYFSKIEASSFKESDPSPTMVDGEFVEPDPENTVRYYPFYAFDSDPTTAWAAYTAIDGKPWIKIDFADAKLVNSITVLNGFKGPRTEIPSIKGAKLMMIEFSDGSQRLVTLKDQDGEQTVKIPTELTKSLKISIQSIYGDDQRVGISEVTPNLSKPVVKPGKAKSFYDSDDFTMMLYGIFTAGSLMVLVLVLLLIRKRIRP
jgi:hypothetical protein